MSYFDDRRGKMYVGVGGGLRTLDLALQSVDEKPLEPPGDIRGRSITAIKTR